MKNELVILFIPKEEEKHWKGSSEEFYKVPVNLNSSSKRALLVVEDCPPTEGIKSVIEEAVSDADRIYVALHGGSSHKETHKEMVGTSRASAVETYSRVSGNPIYKAFEKVIRSIRSESETLDDLDDDTSEALGDLIGQLGPDWQLEMKLEMLHRCLSPEGAERANDEFDFREELRTEWLSLVERDLVRPIDKNDDTRWTVGDVVSALAKDPNGKKKVDFDDCSDSNYQEALGVMRDTLLQEE